MTQIAIQRYEQFLDRFKADGQARFALDQLAVHAALPVGFTADMLYHLVENFGRAWLWDPNERHILVSDWLLSGLCRPVGQGIFELETPLRTHLLDRLRAIGAEQLQEVAKFIYQYAEYRLNAPEMASFKETLLINALVTLRPDEARARLAENLNRFSLNQQKSEVLRYRDLLESFSIQDKGKADKENSKLFPLFQYTVAYKGAMLNVSNEKVLEKFSQLQNMKGVEITEAAPLDGRPFVGISRTVFKDEVVTQLKVEGAIKKTVRALLVGIDEYNTPGLTKLSGCANDISDMAETLMKFKFAGPDVSLSITKLLNGQARKSDILGQFESLCEASVPGDFILLMLNGHSDLESDAFYPADVVSQAKEGFTGTLRYADFKPMVERLNRVNFLFVIDTHCAPYYAATLPDNLVVMAGSTAGEMSYEHQGRGLFSKLLCEALREAKKQIAYVDIFKAVRRKIGGRYKQTPYVHCRPGNEYKGFLAEDLFTDSVVFSKIEACKKSQSPELDLTGLNLTYLPDSIAALTHLKKLDVYDNYLTSLPEQIGELTELEELWASENELLRLPDSLGRLQKLRSLKAENNRLTEFPESLQGATVLQELLLADNYIHFLPIWTADLPALKSIDLRDNPAHNLPRYKRKTTRSELLELFAPLRNRTTGGPWKILTVCSPQERNVIASALKGTEGVELLHFEEGEPYKLFLFLARHMDDAVILHLEGWGEGDHDFVYCCGEESFKMTQRALFKFMGENKRRPLCVIRGNATGFAQRLLEWGWNNCLSIGRDMEASKKITAIGDFYAQLAGGKPIIAIEQPQEEISESKREVRFFSIGAQASSWRLVESTQSQQALDVPCFCFAFYGDSAQVSEAFRHISTVEGIADGVQTNFFLYTHAEVTSHLLKHRDQLRLFHFAGGAITPQEQEELATLLGICSNLRLVFWEAPATDMETELFLSKGVMALISGQGDPNADFSGLFYQNFARPNSKMTLQQAFDAATYSIMDAHDAPPPKLRAKQTLRPSYGEQTNYGQPPLYKLSLRSGANTVGAERFVDWVSSPDAVFSKSWREHLRKLIAEGKLEEALTRLAAAHEEGVPLLARFQEVKKSHVLGLIANDDLFKQQAIISHAALALVDSATEPRQTYA